MTRVFIFSGLGADKRAFQNLDLSHSQVEHIVWTTPLSSDTLSTYVDRLLQKYEFAGSILIGLSFGGIVAVEVMKRISVARLILISSAETAREIPTVFRFMGRLRLHSLLPTSLLKKSNSITNWFFGVSSVTDKIILSEILRDTDPKFLKWAINEIVKWNNNSSPANIYHIHGTSDKILPSKYVKADHWVNNGGHLMILNKAAEIQPVIESLINDRNCM